MSASNVQSLLLGVRSVPKKETWDLPCLLRLSTWLHVSDYRNVWNNERWKSFDSLYSII